MYTAARLASTGRAAVFLRVNSLGITPSVIACGDATFPKGTALVVAAKFPV